MGLLEHYDHSRGRAIFFDGAAFSRIDNGKVGSPKKVAGPGPEYKGFLSLSDENFLVMGDQRPLVILRIDSQGDLTWRRTFPPSWVLPSGAALEDGAACIASPGYGAALLHIVRLDSHGNVQHRAEIPARRALATAGPNGGCAILYDRGSLKHGIFNHSEFFLTALDGVFNRQWTVPVKFDSPLGGVFYLMAVSDGYIVVAEAGKVLGALFMAKYDFSGHLLWAITDSSRRAPSLVAHDANAFYLVGSEKNSHDSLSVIRGR
jgi:hypothetical protein